MTSPLHRVKNRRLVPREGRLAGALALVLVLPGVGSAQADPPEEARPPLATLAVWAEDVWLALVDRDGSYFGRLADEGTFQRFNPRMDAEYELDLRTGMFTPAEDARWSDVRRGLRVSGASISHPVIVNALELREAAPISGPVELGFRYIRRHSLTAQRDYSRLALRWKNVAGSRWDLSTSLGLHFFKPSADVEVAISGRWGAEEAEWQTRLGIGLLDLFSDAIFVGLGVDPEEVEAHFDYTASPFAVRAGLVRSGRSTRVELQGGLTTRSRVEVTFPATEDAPYSLEERVGFAGALVEVWLADRVAGAAYATWARADTRRRGTLSADTNLDLVEETTALGARLRIALSPDLGLEGDVRGVWRPENRRAGAAEPIHHDDREVFAQVALVRRPVTGWLVRLAAAHADRETGVLAPGLGGRQQRAILEWGYRFASEFEVMAGLRWDLDSLGRAPFDGGHLRMGMRW